MSWIKRSALCVECCAKKSGGFQSMCAFLKSPLRVGFCAIARGDLGVCFFLVLTFFSQNSISQTATATLDRNEIRIGEPIRLTLNVDAMMNTKISWPQFADKIDSFDVTYKSVVDSIPNEKGKTISQTFNITAFDSGNYELKPIVFLLDTNDDDQIDTVKTKTQLITVTTVEVDTTKGIRPIKGLMEVSIGWRERLPWIIGGGIVLLIGGVITFFATRKKPAQEIPVRQILMRPIHEIALEKLTQLEEEKLWQKGEEKQYHLRLSEIMREYLDYRFGFIAIEATTEEIISHMSKEHLSQKLFAKLKEIFESGDLVKFAKMNLLPDEHHRCLTNAVEFVNGTFNQSQPENAAEKNA